MKDKIIVTFFEEEVVEGGSSRNRAFAQYFAEKGYDIWNLKLSRNPLIRLYNLYELLFFMISSKKRNIIIHGNLLVSFTLFHKFPYKWYIFILKKILAKCATENRVFLEINDLRYEQAIDLEIETFSSKVIEAEVDILYYTKGLNYIFASHTMAEYATQKYLLDSKRVHTAINGGEKISERLMKQKKNKSEKLKFVYAGTLNRGRQIEEMIEVFGDIEGVELHLLGTQGEWIKKYNTFDNVKFLGFLPEREAHEYLTVCDMGLIPYDSDRFYYNLCYPTKASFYLTAGIPFLSTELDELRKVINNKKIAIFEDMKNWREVVGGLDQPTVLELKKNTESQKQKFEWEFILNDLEKEISKRSERI